MCLPAAAEQKIYGVAFNRKIWLYITFKSIIDKAVYKMKR